MPAVYVEAHLEAMWKVGYENGDARLGDAQDVELAAEWAESGRDAGEWFKAVGESGWIDEVEPGVYEIHDLLDHAPDYVKRRAAREAERRSLRQCQYCGQKFKPGAKNAKFCSDSCRVMNHRNKSDGELTAVNDSLRCGNVTLTAVNGTPAPAPIIHHPVNSGGNTHNGEPPFSPPPASPSMTSPTSPDDDLDSRIRRFIGGHKMLTYSPRALAICRQIAASPAGWEGMVIALDEALAAGAAEPFTYARSIVASAQARERIKAKPRAPTPQTVPREEPKSKRIDF